MTDSDRPRVLLVDDEPAVLAGLAPTLRGLARLDAASRVEEALQVLATHEYDAAIVDLHLGDGVDVTPLLDALATVPTLLVSGRDKDALERIAKPRGWSYLAKPFSGDVARHQLAELLGVEDAPGGQPSPRRQSTPDAPVAARPATPLAVMVLDRLGDIVAMLIVGYLCAAQRIDGALAVAVIGAIAGVGTGIRQIAGRQVGAGSAAVAVATLLALGAPSSPAQASVAPPPHLASHDTR